MNQDRSEIIILETARLILRQFHYADLETLGVILRHREVMRYSLSGPKSRLETREFIQRCLATYQAQRYGIWAVVLKPARTLIGYSGLIPQMINGRREMEIGYRLAFEQWGNGYATEAASAVRDYALKTLQLPRVISIIEPANTRSWHVAEKIGMTYEQDSVFGGKDVRIYALNRQRAEG